MTVSSCCGSSSSISDSEVEVVVVVVMVSAAYFNLVNNFSVVLTTETQICCINFISIVSK